MNRADLVADVAHRAGIDKTAASNAVDAVLGSIQVAVASGDKVSIPGFGSFELVHRPERDGRNPSTGEAIRVAESWTAKFKPGAGFKGLVNGQS